MDFLPVSYIAIESPCGRFELSDLFHPEDNSQYQEPALKISDRSGTELEYWDNDKYVLEVFQSLERDHRGQHYLDLMFLCATYKWDFDQVVEILKGIFTEAKRLKLYNL